MILVDTNIISELMRPQPHKHVVKWLSKQPLYHLYISSVTVTEIMYGLNRMPDGKRKTSLITQFNQLIEQAFYNRILTFGYEEAWVAAKFRAERLRKGHELHFADAQIAAIAHVHQCAVATRNIKDFQGLDLSLINPFVSE